MSNDWQVIFFAGAPMWQYGDLIQALQAPDGQKVPFLNCSAVALGQSGFLELTVVGVETAPVLTLLVRQDHVMCAIRMKHSSPAGFATKHSRGEATAPTIPPTSPQSDQAA